MRTRLLAAVLAVAAVGAASAADEAVTIRLKKPAAGESVKDIKSEELDVNHTVDGKAKPTMRIRTKYEYTDKAVEGDGKTRATKLERTYKTMDVTVGEKLDTGLGGKTVLIQKGKEKYTFTVDGKTVSEIAAGILDGEFNTKDDHEQMLLPTKPVKAGDTWDVPVKAVDKLFSEGYVADAAKVKATGQLVKVYEKNKAKYGVVKYTIELPISSMMTENGMAATSADSLLKATITYDGCIDGTVYESTNTIELGGEVKARTQGMELVTKISGTISTKSEPVK